jgi:hypothetical protein
MLLVATSTVDAAPAPGAQPPQGAAAYEAPPRPTDGANLALTVEKLEKGFDPERPFLIWAIGSSFTNGLGNGDYLIELIRERFPNAPKIVYKKMAGCSTSYHFLQGWTQHLVIPDQPDLVLIYNFGNTEDLEKVIVLLRRHTTADIVVPTLHWCIPHKPLWGQPDVRNSHQDPPAMRAMCAKYGVEFVENRLEMTQYMTDHKLSVEDLLADSVHENRYAAKMTVMNIARHIHRPENLNYDPRSRERRVEAESSAATRSGDWQPGQGGAAVIAKGSGDAITLAFTGNRIDLIGWRSPEGGSAEVWIDGQLADQTPVFYAGYVEPDNRNAVQPPMPPRDRSPHGVRLAGNLVPQKWTITMTSDQGDFELLGSVTGPDGKGNAFKPFTSNSGQIQIDPALWREARTNRTGDTFRFEVYRPTVGRVEYRAAQAEKFRLHLAENLPNGPHTLKLVAKGDGPMSIDAFDVFEPPLRPAP